MGRISEIRVYLSECLSEHVIKFNIIAGKETVELCCYITIVKNVELYCYVTIVKKL